MPKLSNPAYVEKVKKLSKIETERLLSRMSGKLPRRLEKDKLSRDEALALQMELEDEQLQEWRKMMASLNQKIEAKERAKGQESEGVKVASKLAAKEESKKKSDVASKEKVTAQAVAKPEKSAEKAKETSKEKAKEKSKHSKGK